MTALAWIALTLQAGGLIALPLVYGKQGGRFGRSDVSMAIARSMIIVPLVGRVLGWW